LEHLARARVPRPSTGKKLICRSKPASGNIRHHGLVGDIVIVSEDAGQFRINNHARCWVYCERLLQKLIPARANEALSVAPVRFRVWQSYKALKAWKPKPSPQAIPAFRRRTTSLRCAPVKTRSTHRSCSRTVGMLNYCACSGSRRKSLRTQASESDLRSFVTKRIISGGQ